MTDNDPVFDAPPAKVVLRDYQEACLSAIESGWKEASRLLIVLATGAGKCLGRGTPILLHDGKIAPVEQIVPGDKIMGPDSSARTVISVCRGQEQLYQVMPVKGEPFIINESHILSFRMTGNNRKIVMLGKRKISQHQIINISVKEYLASSKTFKHCAKLWRTGVEFKEAQLHPDLPPYILGLWLGDGSSLYTNFATVDPEILEEIKRYAASLGHFTRVYTALGKCPMVNVTTLKKTGRGHKTNRMRNVLNHYGLLGNKHIPSCYKISSRFQQLELLAGLMDTDGSLSHSSYDFISKYEHLSKDVCFLARSLGLAAYIRKCQKKCGQNGKIGTYYRVQISGDVSIIPCRIARKKASPRKQKKNVLNSGVTITPLGIGDYFGFELEGPDRLFLLGDFTVTHNTVLFSREAKITVNQGGKVLILAHTDELLEQAIDKLARSTGLIADKEKAQDVASPYSPVVVASIQTLSRVNRLIGFPDDHFSLVIVDEAHRSLAPSYQRVMNYFHFGKESLAEDWKAPEPGVPYTPKARVLGVTATADRGDKRTLGEFFQKCAYEYGLLEACRDGYLVKPMVKNIPIQIDLRGIKTSRLSGQSDFDVGELGTRIAPFLRVIAQNIASEARNRKTVCFLPSIETARLLAQCLSEHALNASFVSGMCPDREQKIANFHAAGLGSVICNAMLLTEGWDCPDASCICVLRPTKIRSLFTQCVGRATRTLPGIIDGLATREERLAAIAVSAKPDMLILDFLWLTDRLDLVKPIDLVATSPEIRKQMEENPATDLIECQAAATRDLLKALEAAAKKNSRKKARVIDPLAWAVSLGDTALAGWEPENRWDMLPATVGQLDLLRKQGIDTTNITCKGLASKLIERVLARMKLGLCTPKQLSLMAQLGLDEHTCALLTIKEATMTIASTLSSRKARRESARVPALNLV